MKKALIQAIKTALKTRQQGWEERNGFRFYCYLQSSGTVEIKTETLIGSNLLANEVMRVSRGLAPRGVDYFTPEGGVTNENAEIAVKVAGSLYSGTYVTTSFKALTQAELEQKLAAYCELVGKMQEEYAKALVQVKDQAIGLEDAEVMSALLRPYVAPSKMEKAVKAALSFK